MRVVCLLLAAVLACKGKEQPPATIPVTARIPLRYHPRAGAVYRYWLEQTSRFAPDTATAADSSTLTSMTLAFTQTVGARAVEGIPVTITLDSTAVASPMLSPTAAASAAGALRGLRLTAVLDERLRIVRNDLSSLSSLPPLVREQVQLGVQAAALPLPEQPVGAGDEWTNETELPFAQLASGTALKVTSKITVRGITVTGADTLVALGVETILPDRPLQFAFGGQTVTVALRGGLTGEQALSLTRGAVVSGTLGGTIHLTVTGGFFGSQGMAMQVEQHAVTRLVETPLRR
jgi:hypothetical protein